MKLYRREEIVRALGLETRRRSELALLLILERLQSETLAGEQRSAVLKDLIGQYAEVLRIRSGLRPSRTQREFQVYVYHQTEIWLGMRTLSAAAADIRNIANTLSPEDQQEIRDHLNSIAAEIDSYEPNAQRRRAQTLRSPKPFNQLLEKILKPDPTLPAAVVLERLGAHVGGGVIDEIDSEGIMLSPIERTSARGVSTRDYETVKIKNFPTRVSRARQAVRQESGGSARLKP